MRVLEILKEENKEVWERYELARGRIALFPSEKSVREPLRDYFVKIAEFVGKLTEAAGLVLSGELYRLSMEELRRINYGLYEDILPEHYAQSYGNPAFAVKQLGKDYGRLLTVVYSELRSLTACAFEGRLAGMTAAMELLIELYNCFEAEDEHTKGEVREALYYYIHDYMEDFKLVRAREKQDPTWSFAADIIMESDLSDLRYLYYFGEYITENELRLAAYLNALPEDTVRSMADTYTGGYIRGFETMGADLSIKSIVNLRYVLGFERMLRCAMETFQGMGKRLTIHRAAANLAVRSYGRKDGYFATSANPQYEYDHKNDQALYFDRRMQKASVQASRAAFLRYQPEYAAFAGPAVIEVFGEPDFIPVNKKEAVRMSQRASQYLLDAGREISLMMREFVKQEETSYTIIAFPLPSIGDDFEAIFRETIRVNTLDNDAYRRMQQVLIDALDTGSQVYVRGAAGNRTEMYVQLHELTEPSRQTNFENCTADVNIPVGEVFTSPKLAGTHGTLHVSRVYLNGLEYRGLEISFENGKITDYRCENFASEEENRSYIRENILHSHDTLPIGEFAIGTNTVAYAMGRKYGVQSKLPILIAEKTGPHFAVGDTCYRMSEEHAVFNPDGKEIIARDNEVSILRKTEIEKAYMNCHTDITIPYDEIGEISVLRADGSRTVLIRDGRFVIAGAEGLNAGLDKE
ncbi:MAG: aminopeptidase [Lachnospiraceae bacterium]|nr:aminopeptidase [Lachnospiraceae bacterium]